MIDRSKGLSPLFSGQILRLPALRALRMTASIVAPPSGRMARSTGRGLEVMMSATGVTASAGVTAAMGHFGSLLVAEAVRLVPASEIFRSAVVVASRIVAATEHVEPTGRLIVRVSIAVGFTGP